MNKFAKTFFALTTLFLFSYSGLNSAQAQVILAEDFFYAQPTKSFGAGGGFTRQDYGGGQHSELGRWEGTWNSFGDGTITGTDISGEAFVEVFNPETDMFAGVTRNGLSDNWLDRDFSLTGLDDDQTIFFGITMRSSDEVAVPNATFSINDAGGAAQIGMGFTEGGFRSLLGDPEMSGDIGVVPGPEITEGLDPHRLIGKLEINASGDNERLTVWLDPTDVETAVEMVAAEADVVSGISDFGGNLRLDQVQSGGLLFWDDLAIGTTWESVSSVDVPRVTLQADTEDGEMFWANETDSDLDITFLQASSEAGLNDRLWESLADQGVAGFQENSPSGNLLTESNLFQSLNLPAGEAVAWGRTYRRGEDVIARVGTTDGLLNLANVVYGEFEGAPGVSTDFNGDGTVGLEDIDALCSQISNDGNGAAFDLTGDGVVNSEDLASFLEQTGSLAGDFNLDGEVAFGDFLVLSTNFGGTELSWSHGDADCNGAVQFSDFLTLSSNFGASAAGAQSVPEPNGSMLVMLGMLYGLTVRRRCR